MNFLPILLSFSFLLLSSIHAVYEEKPLVIGICSFNNADWCKKNLDSVFSQHYNNYRVIYIDDCSSDGTADVVAEYVKECGQEDRFTLIKNRERHLALANHYQINHSCSDNEIIVSLDGDDWFSHSQVLKKINDAYKKKKNWVVYSQFKRWPNGKKGYSKAIPLRVVTEKSFRNHEWVTGQTRTYYAWLVKSIKLKDFIMHKNDHDYFGKFFPSSCDVAMMLPMLEMAGGKHHFLKESLYTYNMHDFTDYRTNGGLQGYCSYCIRTLPPYRKLNQPKLAKKSRAKVDIVVIDQEKSGVQISQPFGCINNHYAFNGSEDCQYFQEILRDNTNTQYLLLSLSDGLNLEDIDLEKGMRLLNTTKAYAWYSKSPLEADTDEYFTLNGKDHYFWFFGASQVHPHQAPLMLIKKKKMVKLLDGKAFDSIASLINYWQTVDYDKREVGLFEKPTSTACL